MTRIELKKELNAIKLELPETQAIRLHRAISWLQCAEDQNDNLDLQFISLWIAFNACYAIPLHREHNASEKERFGAFVAQLLRQTYWSKIVGKILCNPLQ